MLLEIYPEIEVVVAGGSAAASPKAARRHHAMRASEIKAIRPSVEFVSSAGMESPIKYRAALIDEPIEGENDAYVLIGRRDGNLVLSLRGLRKLAPGPAKIVYDLAKDSERRAWEKALKDWKEINKPPAD